MKNKKNKTTIDRRLLVNILKKPFLITDVSHDCEKGDDSVHIVVKTTHGDFTIYCQTQGQERGVLMVDLGYGEDCKSYKIKAD